VPLEAAHRFGIAACVPTPEGHLRVERLVEKPAPGQAPSNLAVLGRYLLTPEVLDALDRVRGRTPEQPEIELTDALSSVLSNPPGLFASPFAGQLFDSGTPGEYARSLARYTDLSSD
jgi:UTP--glucose-1-phosphate uridylyltransferase